MITVVKEKSYSKTVASRYVLKIGKFYTFHMSKKETKALRAQFNRLKLD